MTTATSGVDRRRGGGRGGKGSRCVMMCLEPQVCFFLVNRYGKVAGERHGRRGGRGENGTS